MFASVLSFVLIISTAIAGGANGGGTDHLPDDFGVAWYLDDVNPRHVKVCIEQDAEKFPMDQEIVKTQFLSALSKWRNYIEERDVYAGDEEDEDLEGQNPRIVKIVTDFRFIDTCAGADLKIYLGVENKEIKEIRDTMNDPYAFAHRKSYDEEKGWGNGILWLKGETDGYFYWDKNQYLNLHGVLLHELGHIFGTEHIPGTIMDVNFGGHLSDQSVEETDFWYKWYKFYMTNIDWSNEIIQQVTVGKFPELGLYIPGTRAEREAFQFIAKRSSKGNIRTNLKFQMHRQTDEFIHGTYVLADDAGTFSFPLHLRVASSNVVSGERSVFARLRGFKVTDEDGDTWTNSLRLTSDSSLLNIGGWVEMNGKNVPVILDGVAAEYDIGLYPEDRQELRISERKFPYRLLALDGENRHFLYSRYEWIDLNNTGEKKAKRLRK